MRDKAKHVFHALTAVSAIIAAYGGLVPQKDAQYVAAASAVISAALHFIAKKYPDVAEPAK